MLPTVNHMAASYVPIKKTTEEGINVHAGWNIPSLEVKWKDSDKNNPYREEIYLRLMSRFGGSPNVKEVFACVSLLNGKCLSFAAPSVSKREQNRIFRSDIANMFKEQKSKASEDLKRKLSTRQKKEQIEKRGIVPQGYFQSPEKALVRHHRRFSSTVDNMNIMLKMRPTAEEIVEKGMVEFKGLLQMYALSEDESDQEAEETKGTDNGQDTKKTAGATAVLKKTAGKKKRRKLDAKWNEHQPAEISLTRSLLFSTTQEALRKSQQQTAKVQEEVQQVVQEIARKINRLRDESDRLVTVPNVTSKMSKQNHNT
ncbi:hypothetical protein RFI_04866 [Reticulomyxa filosa]|uniref:Uncharacterized protein n=1 Tax=Reticulomyxa filosa TaxID=46433 RepID=X6P2E3_RETFI|nr:hypothetical protein RFI_04866 [Reticulomyxa filosa]|eukprot:ETO32249.1 hypothetical protein RFI_04866 [Reticulomyxa filosa]